MKFKLEINCDNAAFADGAGHEVGRLLREVIKKIERGDDHATIQDLNGNTVGQFHFTKK